MIPAIALLFIVPRAGIAWLFAIGFCLALFQSHAVLDGRLDKSLEKQDVWLEGAVIGVPEFRGTKLRFEMRVDRWDQAGAPPGKVRLSWYKIPLQDTSDDAVEPAVVLPGAGEVWRLPVRLRRPHGFMNPGGFDYEKWLFQRGISAVGYVHARDKLPEQWQGWRKDDAALSLDRWRSGYRDRLMSMMQDSPAEALVVGLVLGLRDGVSQRQWEVLRRTGTSHLMAISGLHIGMVSGLVFALALWLWKRCARCCESVAAPRVAAFVALLAGSGYAALAGFSIPTQRALVMLAVVMITLMAGRTVRPWYSLALALGVVLVLDTSAVLSAGFWLSFYAVGVIILSFSWSGEGKGWIKFIGLQLLLSLCFIPVTLWFFSQASLVSPLANTVAVPWVTLFTVPLALAGASLAWLWPSLSAWLLDASAMSAGWLMQGLEWLSSLPYAQINTGYLSLPPLLISVAGLMVLLASRQFPAPRRAQAGGVLLLLVAVGWVGANRWFGFSQKSLSQGEMQVSFLDVGQGLSVVVETASHALIYDLGGRFSEHFNAVDAVVLPFLQHQGISAVDTLVISHDDLDHYGAYEELFSSLPVDAVLTSVRGKRFREDRVICEAGQSWEWDGVKFSVLHPSGNWVSEDNDMSCVIRVASSYGSVLLTGDISRKVEALLLETSPEELVADVLQVPHHGSKTSSSAAFIAGVRPWLAIFDTGYANRWNFPRPEIKSRYDALGITTLQTDQTGAILLRFAEDAGNLGNFGDKTGYRASPPDASSGNSLIQPSTEQNNAPLLNEDWITLWRKYSRHFWNG